MNGQISVTELFTQLESRVNLEWVAGKNASDIRIDINEAREHDVALVGQLNLIHASQIQLIGRIEMNYLNQLPPATRAQNIEKLFTGETDIILLANNQPPPEDLINLCDHTPVALMRSPERGFELMVHIRHILLHTLADRVTLHGVFMEVAGLGILITGSHGAGKSELALELISRGHRLIADDAPLFTRISPQTIRGTCPELLQDFLEVRGLGILNIRKMFGNSAIKNKEELCLIIQLTPFEDIDFSEENRFTGISSEQEILSINIPTITIPVAPGRNLGVLVEAAARDHLLKVSGYNASADLQQRQKKLMNLKQ